MPRGVPMAAAPGVLGNDRPAPFLERGLHDRATHQDLAALGAHLLRAAFPHHARSQSRVAKGLDQRLDHFAAPAREERVADRSPERQTLDPLRRPVSRNLLAGHSPDLLRIGLEEDLEESSSELVRHPVLEGARLPAADEPCLEIGQRAADRLEGAQLHQRLGAVERVGEVLAPVVDARRTRPHQEIVTEDLGPEILHLVRFRKEPVPSDVEAKPLVALGPRDAADMDRIALEHRDPHSAFGEEVRRGQPGRPRPDDGYLGIDGTHASKESPRHFFSGVARR